MSYEFSRETRQILYEEPYCGECGRNSNAMLEAHHINNRTSNSPINAILLCKKCHDKIKGGKEELIKYTQIAWKRLKRNYPDYKITQNDLKHLENLANKFGITVSELIQKL